MELPASKHLTDVAISYMPKNILCNNRFLVFPLKSTIWRLIYTQQFLDFPEACHKQQQLTARESAKDRFSRYIQVCGMLRCPSESVSIDMSPSHSSVISHSLPISNKLQHNALSGLNGKKYLIKTNQSCTR